MADKYAGRFADAFLDSNTKLLKFTSFSVFTDSAGTVAATTYTDRTASTVRTAPLSTDAYGTGEFFAAPGTYYISVAGISVLREVDVYEDIVDTADQEETIGTVIRLGEVSGHVHATLPITRFAIVNGHGVYYADPTDVPSGNTAYFDPGSLSLTLYGAS